MCSCSKDEERGQKQFEKIDSSESGVDFSNQITENDTLNYYTFPYLYMGGGVSVGDINNDGLQDIFFTGNMSPNRLYLNKGNFEFEDISESAGVLGDDRWYTGSTMVDINADGWLDIYASVSGIYQKPVNQLYINNGNNTFSERALDFGLADETASIQATFFDYDKDGFLDVFVANYPQVEVSMGNQYYYSKIQENLPENSGHLYHNEGIGKFSDVTQKAGLQNFGLTLGVVSVDLNEDGWTDLYLSNDFNVPDYLYLNNGDGTFRETLKESVGHTAMFGMGLDAADFNNDGLVDLAQVDMTPSDHKRSKTNMASMSPLSFFQGVEMGFHYQYMQNTIQLNNGSNTDNTPLFSDIARMTGIATTDWSWGILMADFNNDGSKDIFITNGVLRDVNNNDVLESFDKASFFGVKKDYTKLPSTPLSNYVFENLGELSFAEQSQEWGLDDKGFSNGVAYADLNNDGNLDLIVNNVNSPASIYRNLNPEQNNHLRIKLKGTKDNLMALGTKVSIQIDGSGQYTEHTLTRGFQSSVESTIHFGLGNASQVDLLKITWPDGTEETLRNIEANQEMELKYVVKVETKDNRPLNAESKFSRLTEAEFSFEHIEDDFDDFSNEPLLPHKNSNLGPASSIGDVNQDGLDDIFIGNAKGSPGALFIQGKSGRFTKMSGPWELDSLHEDTGSVLVDLDGDDDLDLYVVSGGNDPSLTTTFYQDRIYINNQDQFSKLQNLPNVVNSGKLVLPFDFDMDGDLDLLIGGRILPGKYPFAPETLVLENRGGKNEALRFESLDASRVGALGSIGLITSGKWANIAGDEAKELILTGEWMGMEVFSYEEDKFKRITEEVIEDNPVGWWRSLEVADIDQDGDNDLIAGNLGLNYKYKASKSHPFSVYASDFDENGRSDIVLSYEKKGKKLPLRGRECSSEQVPAIAQRFETYEAFADASLDEIYGEYMLQKALHYEATSFAHCWFENRDGKLIAHKLPTMSQISSVEAILPFDYNGDAYPDFVLAGNLLAAEVETTRNDASYGIVLQNDEKGGFLAITPRDSGLKIQGEVKAVEKLNRNDGADVLAVFKNNSTTDLWSLNRPKL
ncbi:MAG: CRTAC1 family protein [Cyclobacteriaceae bacterium]